jgi:hypothetical protein
MQFQPKDQYPDLNNQTSLFNLCSSVLKNYVEKETKLMSIKQEKLKIAQEPVAQRASDQ